MVLDGSEPPGGRPGPHPAPMVGTGGICARFLRSAALRQRHGDTFRHMDRSFCAFRAAQPVCAADRFLSRLARRSHQQALDCRLCSGGPVAHSGGCGRPGSAAAPNFPGCWCACHVPVPICRRHSCRSCCALDQSPPQPGGLALPPGWPVTGRVVPVRPETVPA